MGWGHSLLIIAIRSSDCLRNDGLVENEVEPIKIRFIGVASGFGIRYERRGPAGANTV
jgi:hypothetical protein